MTFGRIGAILDKSMYYSLGRMVYWYWHSKSYRRMYQRRISSVVIELKQVC